MTKKQKIKLLMDELDNYTDIFDPMMKELHPISERSLVKMALDHLIKEKLIKVEDPNA